MLRERGPTKIDLFSSKTPLHATLLNSKEFKFSLEGVSKLNFKGSNFSRSCRYSSILTWMKKETKNNFPKVSHHLKVLVLNEVEALITATVALSILDLDSLLHQHGFRGYPTED